MATCHITIEANLRPDFNTGIYKRHMNAICKSQIVVKSSAMHFKLQREKMKNRW